MTHYDDSFECGQLGPVIQIDEIQSVMPMSRAARRSRAQTAAFINNIVDETVEKALRTALRKEKKRMMKEIKKKIDNDLEMTDFEELCAAEWDMWS